MYSFLCHIHIRNDGDQERWFECERYSDKKIAVKDAIELIYNYYEPHKEIEQLGERERRVLSYHLSEGKTVWIWEWEDRGNGDKIWIIDADDDPDENEEWISHRSEIQFWEIGDILYDEYNWMK
nr:hypothetical protein pmam_274 [Pithovirus mammoth]